jgi:hypothetical protein
MYGLTPLQVSRALPTLLPLPLPFPPFLARALFSLFLAPSRPLCQYGDAVGCKTMTRATPFIHTWQTRQLFFDQLPEDMPLPPDLTLQVSVCLLPPPPISVLLSLSLSLSMSLSLSLSHIYMHIHCLLSCPLRWQYGDFKKHLSSKVIRESAESVIIIKTIPDGFNSVCVFERGVRACERACVRSSAYACVRACEF